MSIREFEKYVHDTLHHAKSPVDEKQLFEALGIEEEPKRKTLVPYIAIGAILLGLCFYAYHRLITPQEYNEVAAQQKSPNAKLSTHTLEASITPNNIDNTRLEDTRNGAKESFIRSTQMQGARHNDVSEIAASSIKSYEILKPAYGQVRSSIDMASPLDDDAQSAWEEDPRLMAQNESVKEKNKTAFVAPLDMLSVNLERTSPLLLNTNKVDCPEFSHSSVQIKMGIEISSGMTSKSLTTEGGDNNSIYILRQKNENPLEYIGLKLFTEIEADKTPIGLKLGSTFTRYVEKMKYKDTYMHTDTTVGIISQTVSPNGDTITTIYGDIITETEIDVDKSVHFSLYTLDIPVTATYGIDVSSNSSIQIELGAALNLRMWKDGSMITGLNTFTPVKDIEYFKKSLGVSFIGQLNYRLDVAKGTAYVGVGLKHIPKSLALSSTRIRHMYTSYGLNLGYCIPL